MSSELERLLREARETLPDPDEDATRRARKGSLAGLRRSRPRKRVVALLGVMFVVAIGVGVGVGIGTFVAPSVTAAREPGGLGFVPEPGWFALQSPPPAVPGQQTVAVAANVPLAADDVNHGLVEPSGLPYSTLLTLPPHGTVIVATMTPAISSFSAPALVSLTYPEAELPLRLRDAVQYVQWGTQVRPDQPLAQYQLRVNVRDYNVDLMFYFGTPRPSSAMLAEAQRQLERLVVRSTPTAAITTGSKGSSAAPALSVIDRTYACRTVLLGGVYGIETRAHAGLRGGSNWSKLPYAVVSSGGWAGLLIGYPYARANSLAWITAGTPSHETTVDHEGETFPVRSGGTLGVNRTLCKPARESVSLRSSGLRGGSADAGGAAFDCAAPRKVVVRFRATVRSKASLHELASDFFATNAVVRDAKLAVRTPSGKLLAYAEVVDSGKARLFIAPGCTPD